MRPARPLFEIRPQEHVLFFGDESEQKIRKVYLIIFSFVLILRFHMSGEHDYSREVVVGVADPPHNGKALEDIRSSIAALAATVESLVAKQQENEQPIYRHVDNEEMVSLGHYDKESEDSLYAPSRPKSQRTSLQAEGIRPSAQSLVGMSACTGISALFAKKPEAEAKYVEKDLDVEEEILTAVEAERPPVAPLPEGEPLLPKLADRVKRYWQTDARNMRRNQDSYKALVNTHRPPENCKFLTVPLINEGIYKGLAPSVKRKDGDMTDIQKDILSANCAVLKIANQVLEADSKSTMISSKDLVKMSLDAVTFLGLAHSKLNNLRKSAIQLSLDPDIRDVCSAKHEVTTYLFGDDLAKSIKEARELNKITHLMQKGSSHQGRQHITAQKSASVKTSSRKSSFRQARKAPFREKKPYKN